MTFETGLIAWFCFLLRSIEPKAILYRHTRRAVNTSWRELIWILSASFS